MNPSIIEKHSLKNTIQRAKRLGQQILWYPHCGWDFNFLNSILTKNYLVSPRMFILNDIDVNDWSVDLENQSFNVLEFQVFQFNNPVVYNNRESVQYYCIETDQRQKVHIIKIHNLSSSDLLLYFLNNHIQIDHVFTSRMAGGLTIDFKGERSDLISESVRNELNYKYLITDLHCLSIDHGDEINLTNFEFTVLEKVFYRTAGNIESVVQLCKNNLHN